MQIIRNFFRNKRIDKVNSIFENSSLTTRAKILLILPLIKKLDIDKSRNMIFSTPFIDAETISKILGEFTYNVIHEESFNVVNLKTIQAREDVTFFKFFCVHDGFYVNASDSFNNLLLNIEGFCTAMKDTDTDVVGMNGMYRRLSETLLEDLLKLVVILAVQ